LRRPARSLLAWSGIAVAVAERVIKQGGVQAIRNQRTYDEGTDKLV
jgi:hypothetical protein